MGKSTTAIKRESPSAHWLQVLCAFATLVLVPAQVVQYLLKTEIIRGLSDRRSVGGTEALDVISSLAWERYSSSNRVMLQVDTISSTAELHLGFTRVRQELCSLPLAPGSESTPLPDPAKIVQNPPRKMPTRTTDYQEKIW
ncbi:hypothetical protein DUI87_21131 [Hirundo rustica rustica]|uniref:Uncharacterized protein n=1 Tax=Hirundo rustica rustica TaxID=333673 RepID=A0A3M0JM76_HIRRU|nr:hypothetical protein DUI87_21131 [Hirundo rustica rustica]